MTVYFLCYVRLCKFWRVHWWTVVAGWFGDPYRLFVASLTKIWTLKSFFESTAALNILWHICMFIIFCVGDSWARLNRWAASVADAIFCAVQRLSSSLPYCGLYLLFFHQMNVLVLLYMGCTENNYFLTFFRSIIDFWIVYVLIFYKVRFDIVESSHQKFKKCIIQFGEIFNYVACLRRLPCSSLITVEVL